MISILKFLAIVGTTIFGAFGSFINYRDNNGKFTKKGIANIVAIIICALFAFGLEWHEDETSKKNENEKITILSNTSKNVDKLGEENRRLQREFNSKDSTNKILIREILSISNINSILSKQLIDYQSGGNSFPLLVFSFITNKSNEICYNFHGTVRGDFPLRNVTFNLRDADIFDMMSDSIKSFKQFHSLTKYYHFAELIPNRAEFLDELPLASDKNEKNLSVEIITLNGVFTQDVKFKIINGYWRIGTVVRNYWNNLESSKILYEKIDKSFSQNDINKLRKQAVKKE